MKKLVLALAIMATAAIAQEATYKFPGWDCRDVVVLNEQLALAQHDYDKVTIATLLDIVQNGVPATVDALSERVAAIIGGGQEYSKLSPVKMTKRIGMSMKMSGDQMERFSRINPCDYDLYLILWGVIDLGKTEYGYQAMCGCLLQYSGYDAGYVMSAIQYINRQAVALDRPGQEVYDFLAKLNRIYTARLKEDKEKWGGVVAQIRTLMEAYQ